VSLLDRIARRHEGDGAGSSPAGHDPSRSTAPAAAGGGGPAVAEQGAAPPDSPTSVIAAAPPPAPAGVRPEEPPAPSAPGAVDRARLRRRARHLRRRRELELRDLGGLVLESHRQGRERPDLVARKVEALRTTDAELAAIAAALDAEPASTELQAPGIGGSCSRCGAFHGASDAFCARCGLPLADHAAAPAGDEGRA